MFAEADTIDTDVHISGIERNFDELAAIELYGQQIRNMLHRY